MPTDKQPNHDFWCPLGNERIPSERHVALSMTPAEWASLSRLGVGEWLSDAQVARLEELGLVERVFGQALLTRLGRVTLGVPGSASV